MPFNTTPSTARVAARIAARTAALKNALTDARNAARLVPLLVSSLALAAAPAGAASSAASAASDSVGTLSGSVSGSLQRSSDSSSKKNVVQGNYRITEVATVEQQPGMLRLTLQALAPEGDDETLWLTLPAEAFARSSLGIGQVVAATQRPLPPSSSTSGILARRARTTVCSS